MLNISYVNVQYRILASPLETLIEGGHGRTRSESSLLSGFLKKNLFDVRTMVRSRSCPTGSGNGPKVVSGESKRPFGLQSVDKKGGAESKLRTATGLIETFFKQYPEYSRMCAVALVGSHARQEFSADSSVEVVFIYDSRREFPEKGVEVFQSYIRKHLDVFEYLIDIQDNKVATPCCWSADRSKQFPGRPIDAQFFGGSRDHFDRYKYNAIQQILGGVKRFRGRLKEVRKFLNVAKSPHVRIKSDTVEMVHSKAKDRFVLAGMKYGHLRSIQYKLIWEVCKWIRSDSFDPEILSGMPSTTMDRLRYFKSLGRLTLGQQQLDKLADAYITALDWYHLGKAAASEGRVYSVPRAKFEDVTTAILEFVSMQSIFDTGVSTPPSSPLSSRSMSPTTPPPIVSISAQFSPITDRAEGDVSVTGA